MCHNIASAFWVLHSMMTHKPGWRRGSWLWEKSKQFGCKKKISIKTNQGLRWNQEFWNHRRHQQPTTTWSAEKNNSTWWQAKAVKKNSKIRVCKIANNLQKAGVMLWQSTVHWRLWHKSYRSYTSRYKPLISTTNRKAKLEFAKASRVLEQCFMDRWDKD